MNRYLLTALTSAALLVPAASALAAPGDPDPTFSDDGLTTVDFGGAEDGVGAAVQPDGKLVALAQRDIGSETGFQIVRLNRDGTPDTTFSDDGKAGIEFGPPEFAVRSHPTALALQPDGKIVVVGDTDAKGKPGNEHDMVVGRLNTDGSPDKTFNGTGRQTIDYGQQDGAFDVAVQDDGKIVVGGTAVIGNDEDFAVARLTAEGQPDTTWDNDGRASTHFQVAERLNAITIAPDGEVVAVGQFQAVSTNTDTAITRYTTAGRPESAFSGDGKRILSLGSKDSGADVAAQPDGKLLVAVADRTSKTTRSALARLTAGGDLDTTFGTGGETVAPLEATSQPAALARTSSGHVVLAGTVLASTGREAMYAFETDAEGHAATTFSGDGLAQLDAPASQSGGDVVVAGSRALVVGANNPDNLGADLAVDAVSVDAAPDAQPAQPPAEPAPQPQAPQAGPAPAPADSVAPVVSKLKLKAARGTEKGAFRLSEQARVKVTVQRKVKNGKRTRLVAARTVTLKGKAGGNAFKVKGLKPGSYRLTLKATDGAGNASKALRKAFVVKKRR